MKQTNIQILGSMLCLVLMSMGCESTLVLSGEFEQLTSNTPRLEEDMSSIVVRDMPSTNNTRPDDMGQVVIPREDMPNMMVEDMSPSNCPTQCPSSSACVQGTLVPSGGGACEKACSYSAVTQCVDGDGCCPTPCTSNNDSDCSKTCGNGVVEGNEVCDGNCPTSCNDGNACTQDLVSGSSQNCNKTCHHQTINVCQSGDGCCPIGCASTNDSDCGTMCGNNIVEPGEVCDGNCPTSCNDGNACTRDSFSGSASSCNKTCQHTQVNVCQSGDGCCPSGCTFSQDQDCQKPPEPTGTDCMVISQWPTAWAQLEDQAFTITNQNRMQGSGCGRATGALVHDDELRKAARCHSLDMVVNGFLSHTGSDGSHFSTRVRRTQFSGFPSAENVAAGQRTASSVMSSWMSSSGHCANIMNGRYRYIGVGMAAQSSGRSPKWTQVFGQ